MSAAAPREPARIGDVVRHYLRLLANERAAFACALCLLAGVLGMANPLGSLSVAASLVAMVFLAPVQWGNTGRVGALDQAMPLGSVRHDLAWIAASAVWAGAALAVPVALMAPLYYGGSRGAGLWWYPPLLWTAELAWYLFGAAVWLRGGRPYSLTWTLLTLSLVPLPLLAVRWLRLPSPGAISQGEVLQLAGVVAVWLAAGVTAAWAAAATPRWVPWLQARPGWARVAAIGRRAARRNRPLPATRPVVSHGLRRPARMHQVLWREIVLLRLGMVPMGAVVVVAMVWGIPAVKAAMGSAQTGTPWGFSLYALSSSWAMAIWLQGSGPWHRRVEPLPVDVAAQRLLRMAAGGVWLVATVAAIAVAQLAAGPATGRGVPGSVGAWTGLACGALLMYLASSLPLLAAREHLMGWAVAWIFFLNSALLVVWHKWHGRLTPRAALSVFDGAPEPWAAAMLLWTAVAAALVVAAVARGVAADRAAGSTAR